jgi:hypothetical protein
LESVRRELREATADSETRMMTPTVLEVIAERV